MQIKWWSMAILIMETTNKTLGVIAQVPVEQTLDNRQYLIVTKESYNFG